MNRPLTLPFGSWPSPVTPAVVARAGTRLAEPVVQGRRTLWLEGRPAERGRGVVVAAEADGRVHDLLPAGYSVRSGVNEYGGGAWTAHRNRLWFVNAADRAVYAVTGSAEVRLLCGSAGDDFADLVHEAARDRLLAVREHDDGNTVQQSLVAVDTATGTLHTLASGDDFYSNPCPAPDGRRLAWLSWNRPCMPWDSTRLWLAELTEDGRPGPARCVAGGDHESVFQPQWGPDGHLYFVSDRNDRWNLYRLRDQRVEPVLLTDGDLGLPQWVFRMSTYGFPDRVSILCAVTRNGLWSIERVLLGTGRVEAIPGEWVAVDHLSARPGEGAVWLAASPMRANSVMRWADGAVRTLGTADVGGLSGDWVSRAQAVQFATGDGETAHGLYYPPVNPRVRAPAADRPPLLVKCHGGPTGAADAGYDARIQYWTSRGFAVLDVNYRGSTGFGRQYRRKLYGGWGVTDVEDCRRGALWLAGEGSADPARLLVSGSSAGGFTVLCALTFHDTFRAGASYYGVADLASLFAVTHRFEADYDRALVGDGSAREREARMRERSPLHHARLLQRPVIFFQGLSDRVVPPDQSRRMAAALRENGVPVALLTFESEGHGFRQSETIARCMAAEFGFYARVLQFAPADPLPPLTIDNLTV